MNDSYGVEKIDDLKPCSKSPKGWGVRRKAKPVKRKIKKPKNHEKIQVIE